MAFQPTQTWYPSYNDIQPNPDSPFSNATPQILDIPLNFQEIHYREICGMLKYTQDNTRQVTKDKKKYSRELQVALMRLNVGGGEGRDGRERLRKVAVLRKVVRSHQDYKKNLMQCESELWRKENELRKMLRLQVRENGNKDYYEGRNWWFVAGEEESDEEDDDDDDDYEDDDDDDDEDEVEGTKEMELECWSEEDEDLEMKMEG
ncbi:uncharacterized protein EAF01_009622 [Botrytis porri]|uniref:Uncharacterized protein n=1 Tax=Botrytis porri TaxID=87229 RepID=A0A4Z1L3Z8_9HELO|nr:uncharacterized protein EAF01_009622 [Botrytis porri]KAF7895660.1 hypothetical protein EAF01_009622 [Botrytis porri]TGO91508.1 hypothetical protein BPOR_0025g00020 [Botrytis porri]